MLSFLDYLQGIAVLAFEVGPNCLHQIFHRYATLHPNLLPNEYKQGPKEYDNEATMFEVYAYYQGEKNNGTAIVADEGTRLRFVEPLHGIVNDDTESGSTKNNGKCILPGVCNVPAKFHSCQQPAYFDHWVSNGKKKNGLKDVYS